MNAVNVTMIVFYIIMFFKIPKRKEIVLCGTNVVLFVRQQSCPWVHFLWPNPTRPINRQTQPNPTHGNLKNLDPTQPKFVPSLKPIELLTPKIQVVHLY